MDIFEDMPEAPAYLVTNDELGPAADLDTFTSETSSCHTMSTLDSEEVSGLYGISSAWHCFNLPLLLRIALIPLRKGALYMIFESV